MHYGLYIFLYFFLTLKPFTTEIGSTMNLLYRQTALGKENIVLGTFRFLIFNADSQSDTELKFKKNGRAICNRGI